MLSASQREVCVGGGAEGVADDEEGYIFFVRVGEDVVGVRLDGLAVGDDDGPVIVALLL